MSAPLSNPQRVYTVGRAASVPGKATLPFSGLIQDLNQDVYRDSKCSVNSSCRLFTQTS